MMQYNLQEEMEEMSKKWQDAMKDSKFRAKQKERLIRMRTNSSSISQGQGTANSPFKLWYDGHNPGSFESNGGCWEHFRKIE